MKSFVEFVDVLADGELHDIPLSEMTGISPKRSGLCVFIWVSSKGSNKHDPRIKVSNTLGKFDTSDNFSISIEDKPEIKIGVSKIKTEYLEDALDWIKLNRTHLLKIWHSDTLDSQDHIDGIMKL